MAWLPTSLALVALASTAQDPAPTPQFWFDPPQRLRAADGVVAVEEPGWASPAWHDVDGDGRSDLVVGQFAGGRMRLYRQLERSVGDPLQLAAGEWLQAGGDVDVNDDGLMDVLSGSYSRMEGTMAGLFQVLYGLPEGSFERARPLLGTDGEPLVLTAGEGPIPRDPQQDPHLIDRICTRPSACDLDGDGNLDLVVGNFRGTFHVFRGRGAGKFAPRSIELLDIEGQPLAVSAHGDPWPVDWDGDGDLDLLSGSGQGGVSWAENRGTAKAPRFAAFRELIAPSATGSDDVERDDSHLVGPEQSTRVTAADADGDGVLDLLVGDTVTVVVSADGVDLEVAREQWRLYRTRSQAAWEAYSAVSDEAGEDDERTRAALDLYRERESELREVCDRFVDERRTGHVWFYRGRTAPAPDTGDGSGAPPPGADR